MINQLINFTQYQGLGSNYTAKIESEGGNLTFSNRNEKQFNLSLKSLLTCLIDIKQNIVEFHGNESYDEDLWRGLGATYYSDNPAHTQSTIQTKPLFITLSKIIMWANSPILDNNNPEERINLDLLKIESTIEKLSNLIEDLSPSINFLQDRYEILNLKEKFADWFISKSGENNNYFSENFGSNRSRLLEKLDEYDSLYHTDYSKNVFEFPKEQVAEKIRELESNLYQTTGVFFEHSSTTPNHVPRAILGNNNYIYFLKEEIQGVPQIPFDTTSFISDCEQSGLIYSEKLITRYLSSLATKPFVLLSGLSGSGKTKLAQSFAHWICENQDQFKIIPVGADWINREPILGYVNALDPTQYILPENGALEVIINANKSPNKPYFLILDEMNLSHVERYFADFLSIMESKENLKLHSSIPPLKSQLGIDIENEYPWPNNLFIIGTVNIDETTYMFSPKVLDRANVIEFRVSQEDITNYLTVPRALTAIDKLGVSMAKSFLDISRNSCTNEPNPNLNTALINFFSELQKVGAEFGFRTVSEINTLFDKIPQVNSNIEENEKIDIAIMQKLLPKLHGSRRKLLKVLNVLASNCLTDNLENIFNERGIHSVQNENIKYPLSFEKIARMYKNAVENGFATYAEA